MLLNESHKKKKEERKMPPQVSTDGAMSMVSFELSGAEPRICGSAVCLRSAFDDRLLLFQKVKIFKALLLFSAGRPGSSCQSALGFVFFFFFFIREERQVGPTPAGMVLLGPGARRTP